MKYIVYITKNIINDKSYIGVHQTENPEVFDGYLGCGVWKTCPSSYLNPKTPFQHAVKKYGPMKFVRSIIKVFNNKEDAYLLESELVNKDLVRNKSYYNITLGGIQPKHICKIIYQYDINGNFIQEWEYLDASEYFETNSLYNSIQHKYLLRGYYWSDIKQQQLDLKFYSSGNKSKIIYEYDENGKCINVYDSLHQTPSSSKVCVAVQTGNKYKNHYYSDKYFEYYKPNNKISLKNVKIYIYNNLGEYCGYSIGVKETLIKVNGKSKESVYNAVITGKPYKGFKLLLNYKNNIEPFELKNQKRKIDVFDLNGNLITTYPSLNKTIKELNLDSSSAYRMLNGTSKQIGNYILKEHK